MTSTKARDSIGDNKVRKRASIGEDKKMAVPHEANRNIQTLTNMQISSEVIVVHRKINKQKIIK